jgi:acetylserotonin N-methyltransferase
MTTLPATSDDRVIWDTWTTIYHMPTVTVADEVGTFAALSAMPMTTSELATKLGIDARALQIHLGVLAALGFVERREGRWQATAAARTWLHPEAEGYYDAVLQSHRERNPLHDQLLATLRTGNRPAWHHSAADEWERGEMPPGLAKAITAYMNAHSRAAAKAVAVQPVFNSVHHLLDVGGGSAIFPIELARQHPHIDATVFEIPTICAEADGYIAASGVVGRVRTQAGNMFTERWPGGFDAHFL